MSSQARHRGSAQASPSQSTRFKRHTARMPAVRMSNQEDDAGPQTQMAATESLDPGARLDPFVRLLATGVARQKFRFRGYSIIQVPLLMGLIAMLLALAMIIGSKLGAW